MFAGLRILINNAVKLHHDKNKLVNYGHIYKAIDL